MSRRTRVLHLVYEDCGAPTGGMGVHCQEILPRLAEQYEITTINYNQHLASGGYCHAGYKGMPRTTWDVIDHPRHPPEPPAGWLGGMKPGTYRVLTAYPTGDFDSHNHPSIQRNIVEHQFLRNALVALRTWEPDIIHVHDCHLWRVAEDLLCLFPRARTVLTVHLSGLISAPYMAEDIVPRYAMQTELTAFGDADAVIAVSRYYRDMVARRARRDDVHAIHNGVDAAFLGRIPYDSAVRARYPAAKPLVVFLGRLTPQKGIEHIIYAAEALPDMHFLILSHYHPMQGCPTVARLREAIARLPNLEWDEQVDAGMEKWKHMRVADIAVVPSNYEPFGIVALEWMALRVPLIVSRVDGLAEFCTRRNATLIEPSGEALVAALRSHNAPRSQLEEGVRTARKYDWDRVADGVARVYEEVLTR